MKSHASSMTNGCRVRSVMTEIDDRRKAFDEFVELMPGRNDLGPMFCEEHDRWLPCRPCLRAKGFYD